MKELRYMLKLLFEWELLFPITLIMVLIGAAVTDNIYREVDGYLGVYSVCEIYIPVVAAYLFAGLVPDEIESGFLELLFTYFQKTWVLLLKKLISAVLLLILMFMPAIVLLKRFDDVDLLRLLWITVPPVATLGSLIFLISIITKHKISGMLFAGSYWACEIVTKGTLTGKYSLYYASYFGVTGGFVVNRLMLPIRASF